MKESTFEHHFSEDFDTVTTAFWKKYWHPKCTHSRAHVLYRHIDEEGNLITKRLHVIYQSVPEMLQMLTGSLTTYAGEESIINPKTKRMEMRTRSLNFSTMAVTKELCIYSAMNANTNTDTKTVTNTSTNNMSENEKTGTYYSKTSQVYGQFSGFFNNTVEKMLLGIDERNRQNGINVMNDLIQNYRHLNIDAMLVPEPCTVKPGPANPDTKDQVSEITSEVCGFLEKVSDSVKDSFQEANTNSNTQGVNNHVASHL